jgi:hypothetical protein
MKTNKTIDILDEASSFENAKMSHMTMVDKVLASKEAKRLVLAINDIYKETKNEELMDVMKRLTEKKKKIDKRLKGKHGLGL